MPDIQSTREDLWVWIYEEQAEQACLEHEEDSNELALNSRSTSRKQRLKQFPGQMQIMESMVEESAQLAKINPQELLNSPIIGLLK